jgi:anti-sigma-K factor RskA
MSDDMTPRDMSGDAYELDELLGAYALDAVDDDERARVEDYLRINPRAVEEVGQHREVATMLAFTGMDAPDGVWARIQSEIEAAPPEPGPELAKVFAMEPTVTQEAVSAPGSSTREARRRVPLWVLGAAAALAMVVGAAVVFTGSGDGSGGDPIEVAYEAAGKDRDSIRTELVAEGSDAVAIGLIDQDGHGFLDAAALPPLDADQTYQLWGVLADGGDVVSLGILGQQPELETFTAESDIAALAVTIEQNPGVISDGNPDGAFVGSFT